MFFAATIALDGISAEPIKANVPRLKSRRVHLLINMFFSPNSIRICITDENVNAYGKYNKNPKKTRVLIEHGG
jgi:hypothetical protein